MFQPMNVTEDGIVIDPRGVGITPITKNILNISPPITVNPSTNVTWMRDEQARNAPKPKYNNIGLINYGLLIIICFWRNLNKFCKKSSDIKSFPDESCINMNMY